MKRKLLVLNLVLLALIAWAASAIRKEYLAGKARAQVVLGRKMPPVAPPPVASLPQAQPAAAVDYADIAQKMLFSKDRNPVVVVETAPVPPKPMPPLPLVYGVMNFPDGPTVVMSEKKETRHRGFQIGQQIGQFTLRSVDEREITFEWDGQLITRRLEEVIEHAPEPVSAPAAGARTASPGGGSRPAPPAPSGQPAPGVSIGDGIKACQAGDTSPAGTIVDGMRKVVTPSPFGQVCRWEPVR